MDATKLSTMEYMYVRSVPHSWVPRLPGYLGSSYWRRSALLSAAAGGLWFASAIVCDGVYTDKDGAHLSSRQEHRPSIAEVPSQ